MKLAIVTNILAPYRLPLFEAMGRRVTDLTVLLMAGREENRQWELHRPGFKSQVLPGFHVRRNGSPVSWHLNHGVIAALRRFDPDIVVSGGFVAANLAGYLYCRLYGKAHVAWAHLTLTDGAERSAVRRLIRRTLVRGSAGCIAESSEAAEAFLHYGTRPDRILTALMPFDTAQFHDGAARARQDPAWADRRGRFRGPVVLAIGQIIPRKGYAELFRIYERVLKHVTPLSLLILGDGPERAKYEGFVAGREWGDVHFAGYVQSAEVPGYLALADAFVFPTLYDPYGLVLAEAMAAELPVLSSIHAASTRDLVVEGVTGFPFDPQDTEAAAAKLVGVLSMSPAERADLGRAAYEKVRGCDAEPSAEAIVRFLRALTGRSESRDNGTIEPAATRCGTCG
jgi:glycosyltransferase involved in cell wall biosynthesis